MGRGRAKAKQTKVARALKYHSPNTDLAALQRELAGRGGTDTDAEEYEFDEADTDTDDVDSDDAHDDGGWAARRR
jgi:hypothetical protein